MYVTNTHIIKSLAVLIALLAITVYAVVCLFSALRAPRKNKFKRIRAAVACLIAVITIYSFGSYISPYERSVEFELVATIEIPPESGYDPAFPHFWHAAYEQFGLYAESFYFPFGSPTSPLGFTWPEMDLKHHTYIITYGQELITLSYSPWETIDTPIHTGAKAGYAVLSDEIDVSKVYIYEIPKIRIDNDLSKTTDYIRYKESVANSAADS